MKPLAPNVLIQGRYLIVQLIGKGGMGEVYLAVDQRLGSAVALKRTSFADDETMANAFEREARILANLRHPILPKVSDHFIDDENQFLVMEHITGDDLSKRLENSGEAFPLSWVLFWADQLLDALHYLHSHEPPIIHRDIKPQNLKLTNDNQIVLLDFGLSKNSLGETRKTSSGSIAGYTPHYAPMEQIRGTGTNAQSDLYSLSATLYQLATNVVPPDALTRADSLLSDLPDPIRPIDELNAEVSPEVSNVILRGMEVRQENRWASAREMQKALRDAFAKLQSAMSAQTIAFSVDKKDAVPFSQPVQDVDPGPQVPAAEPARPLVSAVELDTFSGQGADSASGQPIATDYDTGGSGPANPMAEAKFVPSDVKTEVLLAGESPQIDEYRESGAMPGQADADVDSVFGPADDFGGTEDFSAGELPLGGDFGAAGSFSPDATVPLMTFDKAADAATGGDFDESVGPGETDFFAIPSTDESAESVPEYGAQATTSVESAAAGALSQPTQPAGKKKSGSKMLAVVAGLFVLFFIVAGVLAGVAWYMTRDTRGAEATPSPTPSATTESTLRPSPTLEVGLDNSNIGGENANANSNTKGNSNVEITRTPVPPQPDTPRPTPVVPRPTPVVRVTPKPTAPPRPTPKKTTRTDIEQ